MADRIQVTSAELASTAQEMTATSERIGQEFQQMMSKVQALSGTWTGSAAVAFNGHYEQFNANWSKCQEALSQIATMLRTSATSYDETEAAIAQQFSG
jgi:6 kDa early secretory antigenic target